MKKINVLQLVGDLKIGGAQALIRDYARLMDYDKFNIFIATIYPAQTGANVDLIKHTGAKLLHIYKSRTPYYQLINRISPINSISKRLLDLVQREHIEVIHIHSSMLRYLEPIRGQLKGIKLLYTCHSLPKRYFSGANKIEYYAATHLIKENNLQLIALHQEMQMQLNRLFNIDNTIIIRNGIEFSRYNSVTLSKNELRKLYGIPEDAFVIGHIGRFSPEKNHTFLVDVFYEIKRRKHNAWLLMVGSGPLVKQIESQILQLGINDCVLRLENRSDIPELLKSMDVFIFPSLFEGLPISIIEAQVAGIRVIASDRITKDCFLLPTVIVKDIKETADSWAEAACDNFPGNNNKDISLFDMTKEIKRLESVYSF